MSHWRGWLIFAFVLFVLFYVLSHAYVFMTVGGVFALLLVFGCSSSPTPNS
jgi:uncharacterized membrane protein